MTTSRSSSRSWLLWLFLFVFFTTVKSLSLPSPLPIASSIPTSSLVANGSHSSPSEDAKKVIVHHTNKLTPGSVDPAVLLALSGKYKSRFLCCSMPEHPNCEVFLCGTLHVSTSSADFVKEAIALIRPHYVVLELCDARVDSLFEEIGTQALNVTLASVFCLAVQERSAKALGAGLLTWMQLKAAKAMGSKLGGELVVAAQEGAKIKSTVVLGDRLYGVTIQRIFDKLKLFEKLKMMVLLIFEVLTMSFFRLKEYIKKTENDEDFIKTEIARFGKYLPTFAQVILTERDQYLSQTVCEIARVGFGKYVTMDGKPVKGRVLAVVGAAHLAGIKKHIEQGGVGEEVVAEISKSSKHGEPTWPGRGVLQVVNMDAILEQLQQQIKPNAAAPAVAAAGKE